MDGRGAPIQSYSVSSNTKLIENSISSAGRPKYGGKSREYSYGLPSLP